MYALYKTLICVEVFIFIKLAYLIPSEVQNELYKCALKY